MKNWLPLSIFVAALLLLTGLFTMAASRFVELKGDLEAGRASRSQKVLGSQGLTSVHARMEYFDATLEGIVDTEQQKALAEQLVNDEVCYTRVVSNKIRVGSFGEPFIFADFQTATGTLSLEGIMESNAAREDFVADVRAIKGNINVVDKLEIAPTAKPEWSGRALDILPQFLALVQDGRIRIDKRGVEFGGTVGSENVKSELDARAEETIAMLGLPPSYNNTLRVADAPLGTIFVTRSGNEVVLRGSVPSMEAKTTLIESAESSGEGVKVLDDLMIDPSMASASWIEPALAFVPTFLESSRGPVRLKFGNEGFQAQGQFPDAASRDAADEGFTAIAPRGALIDLTLRSRTASGGQLEFSADDQVATLTGIVPTLTFKNQMISLVRQLRPGRKIRDFLAVRPLRDQAIWTPETSKFIGQILSSSADASFEINERSATLRGRVGSEEVRASLGETAAKLLGDDAEIRNLLSLGPVPKGPLEVLFEENAVYFGSGMTHVAKAEKPKIERVANAIKQSGNTRRLVVGGFADTRGNAAINKSLSIERATAVKKALIELGVPEENMTVESFGEDPTENRAQQWKSRRVELKFRSNG